MIQHSSQHVQLCSAIFIIIYYLSIYLFSICFHRYKFCPFRFLQSQKSFFISEICNHNMFRIGFNRLFSQSTRSIPPPRPSLTNNNLSVSFYSASVIICLLGLAFAAAPLYQIICSNTGLGGTLIVN